MSRLDDIEARLKAATPGPWTDDAEECVVFTAGGAEEIADIYSGERSAENAALIANAPTDIEWLLKVARAAERMSEASKPVQMSEGTDGLMTHHNEYRDALAAMRAALDGK